MLIYEIDRDYIRQYGSIKKAIAAGYYIPRDNDFIRRAFNYGRGTKSDMNRYMHDNLRYCVFIDSATGREIKSI